MCYSIFGMKSNDFYLILPNIRSAHNVGAMFRTADAFGVGRLFLVGYTARPPHVQLDKVSLGAEQWVPWERASYLKPVIKKLKKQGYKIVALEQSKTSVSLVDSSFTAPVALIVGNEVTGVRKDILKLCDRVVHINMHGVKESLNVSVAAGIAMQQIRYSLDKVG